MSSLAIAPKYGRSTLRDVLVPRIGKDFKIVFGGRSSCTDGKNIFVADLPDSADIEARIQAEVSAYHEAEHVRVIKEVGTKGLFKGAKVWSDISSKFTAGMTGREKKTMADLVNVFEDIRIDREVCERYPGCVEKYRRSDENTLQKMVPQMGKAPLWFRATCLAIFKAHNRYFQSRCYNPVGDDQMFGDDAVKAYEVLFAKHEKTIDKASSLEAVVSLAKKVLPEVLKNFTPPPPPPPPPQPPQPPQEQDQQEESDSSGENSEDESDSGESEGKESDSKESKGKSGGSESQEEEPDSEDASAEGEPEPKEKSEEESGDEGSEDSAESEPDSGDTSEGSKESEPGTEDDSEEDDSEGGKSGSSESQDPSESEEDDEDSEGGDSQGESEGSKADPKEAEEPAPGEEDSEEGEPDSKEEGTDPADPKEESEESEEGEEEPAPITFRGQYNEKELDAAAMDISTTRMDSINTVASDYYTVNPQVKDVYVNAPVLGSNINWLNMGRPFFGGIEAKVRHILLDEKAPKVIDSLPRGKHLDTRHLYRKDDYKLGKQPTIWETRLSGTNIDTALHISVDGSGSMQGERWITQMSILSALCDLLDTCSVKYTTVEWSLEQYSSTTAENPHQRVEPVHYRRYSQWGERLNCHRIPPEPMGGYTPTADIIPVGLEELSARNEVRKALVMFTDGAPYYNDYGYNGPITSAAVAFAEEQLNRARALGFKTFGFGIDIDKGSQEDNIMTRLFKGGWVRLDFSQSPGHNATIIIEKLKEAFQ